LGLELGFLDCLEFLDLGFLGCLRFLARSGILGLVVGLVLSLDLI